MKPVLGLAMAFALCASLVFAEEPRKGGQLRLAIQAEPRTLDPAQAADEPAELVRYLTGGVLLRLNRQTQKPEPELAESWSVGDGGRTLTLKLRSGVRFSDGTAVGAADVCHTFRRLTDPAIDAPAGEAFRSVKGGAQCQARDSRTAVLRFGEPLAAVERLLDDIAIQPARPPAGAALTAGAFFVSEQRAGAYLVLRRNPHYWKKDERGVQLPYLDSVRLDVQRNRDFEMMRFREGELHLVNNLDPQLYARLAAEEPRAARDLGVALDTEQMWFNQVASSPIPAHKKAWFRSEEFRRAISEAVDRADIARVVYKGRATPALGPVSPANRLWINPAIPAPKLNRETALARLSQSGFQLRDGTLFDRAGNAVEFSLITNSGNRSREQMGVLIQADLKKIGIKVSFAPMDFPSLIGRITKTFDYDACLLGLVMTDLDPVAFSNIWLSSGPQHQWNPGQAKPETAWEAEIDERMRLLTKPVAFRERKRAYDRLQEIVVEKAPFVYLVNRHALVAVSPVLRGADPVVLRPQTLWNVERLWLAAGPQVSQR